MMMEDIPEDAGPNMEAPTRPFTGSHEIQVSEGEEADLHKHAVGCLKNPGHTQFVPVQDFTIDHLPGKYRDHDLFDLIRATADLTVKIDVKLVSPRRPQFYRSSDVPYPFYADRGSTVLRLGTGTIGMVIRGREEKDGSCLCQKCQKSDTPSKVWGEIRIWTACHVVFDFQEARETKCSLFYDENKSPRVTVDGVGVLKSTVDEDACWLLCETCDFDLLDRLGPMVDNWTRLREKVHAKYCGSEDEDRLTVIVSHPHGCPKQVSVGEWFERSVVNKYFSFYTYTTSTCPGSSGAFVYKLGSANKIFDHVHSGSNEDGTNYSGVGLVDWNRGEWLAAVVS